MIITELLAILSIAAATGLRIALPLLLIGLMSGHQLWSQVPLLSQVPPAWLLGILVSCSVAELMLSKQRSSQRVLQLIEMLLSPGVGALAGITLARIVGLESGLYAIVGVTSALLALVIQLLQLGWFYRPRRPPLGLCFAVDGLCVALVILAFRSPLLGGVIALLLLWLVIRTSYLWQSWAQLSQPKSSRPQHSKKLP